MKINTIFFIVFYLSLFSFCLDVFVSYKVFSKNPDYFINNEMNRNLTSELKDGIPFFQTSIIILMLALYVMTFLAFKLLNVDPILKKLNKLNFVLIIILIISLTGQIIKHLYGAFSWR